MHMHVTVVLLLALLSRASACVKTETKWVDFTSKIVNVEPVNVPIKRQIGGSVKILDGCTFYVRNMSIIPSGNGAYWWGVPVKNNTDPYPRVVAAALGSYDGQGIAFSLDPQYSFDDISIMEIFSEGDRRAYGAFGLSGNVSAYFGLSSDAGLDTNPENPWASSSGKIVFFSTPSTVAVISMSILFLYQVLS
jgi:hypothetical protein